MPTLEQLPNTEQQLGEAEQIAWNALRRQLIERGDRQLPDEPDQGYRIERTEAHEPVSVESAFPAKDSDERATEFARHYVDGTLPLNIVEDAWKGVQSGEPGFVAYFGVPASRYKAAVESGSIPDGLFDTTGKVMHTEPGASELGTLLTQDEKEQAVEAYYHKEVKQVQRYYIDDLEGVKTANGLDARDTLQILSEGYDLTDGGKSIRLLNFSTQKLSEEQLRQAVNAVRSISDKSAGGLFDQLRTITILPEDSPCLRQEVTLLDGTKVNAPLNGFKEPNALALSDRLLKTSEERTPSPVNTGAFFDKHLLPHEPTEGPNKPPKKVSDNEWELTLAHELAHIGIPEEAQKMIPLTGVAPTLYGRWNKAEWIAELGAAEYAGEDAAIAVPQDQREALSAMWQYEKGSKDEGVTYGREQGPRYVVCRELDIAKPLPMRPKNPGHALVTDITYRLLPDA